MRTLVGRMACLLLLAGCAGLSPFNGRIEDGRYYDPEDRFSIQVPRLAFGVATRGQLYAAGGSIGFSDDSGALIRVDLVTGIDQETRALINDPDWKIPLDSRRDSFAALFQQLFPSVSLVHQEYTSWNAKHADYFVFEIEKGSTLVNVRTKERLDALRASLSFVHGDSLYVISIQHTLHRSTSQDDENRAAVIESLRDSLEEVANTIQFLQ